MSGTLSRPDGLPDLLVVAPCLPAPSGGGPRLRWYHMLKFLARHYRVHLGCFVDQRGDQAHVGKVRALCYETCFVDCPAPLSQRPPLRALAAREPPAVRACRSATLSDWIARLARRRALHAALACSAPMARHLAPLGQVARLVDFVEVESDRRHQLAATRRWPMASMWRREAGLLREHERAVARACDLLLFASHSQADLFRALAPDTAHKVAALMGGVDADHFSPHILHRSPFAPGARVLVLAAADDWAHAGAAEWFVREVFAPLRASDPALRLCMTTSGPGGQVHALSRHEGVMVVGGVQDLRPFLSGAAAVVAPLHVAQGAPHGVLEAMAMQKMVIASPAALEGVRAVPDLEVLVAADADDFRRRIQWALVTPGAPDIGKAARRRVMREHSWAASLAPLPARLEQASRELAGLV